MSRERSSGSIPVSTHKLIARDDRKAPVMALRHAFSMWETGFIRFNRGAFCSRMVHVVFPV